MFKLSHKLPNQQHNVVGVFYFGKQGGCNGFKGGKKFYYAYSATFTLLFFLMESLCQTIEGGLFSNNIIASYL
jgi:hypothetical protein